MLPCILPDPKAIASPFLEKMGLTGIIHERSAAPRNEPRE